MGFIVTNLETDSREAVRSYSKRGTARQWFKENKQAVKLTRLSCHRFRSNEVRLWLSVMAHNLGNLWRRTGKQVDGRGDVEVREKLSETRQFTAPSCHEEAELSSSRGSELARAERNEEHRFDPGRWV